MKTVFSFLGLLLSFVMEVNGAVFANADSVRIIGFQYDLELIAPISRECFWDYVMNMSDTITERKDLDSIGLISIEALDHVDVVVSDGKDVTSLLSMIKDLKVYDKLRFSAMESCKEGYYSEKSGKIIWSPQRSLDNRLLLIIFRKGRTEFVWVCPGLVDRGCKRYKLSKKLAKFLSKYTHVFDSYVNQEE